MRNSLKFFYSDCITILKKFKKGEDMFLGGGGSRPLCKRSTSEAVLFSLGTRIPKPFSFLHQKCYLTI